MEATTLDLLDRICHLGPQPRAVAFASFVRTNELVLEKHARPRRSLNLVEESDRIGQIEDQLCYNLDVCSHVGICMVGYVGPVVTHLSVLHDGLWKLALRSSLAPGHGGTIDRISGV